MVVNNKSYQKKKKSHDEKIKNRKAFPLESGQCIEYFKKCAGWHNDICETILAHLVSHEANERWPVL